MTFHEHTSIDRQLAILASSIDAYLLVDVPNGGPRVWIKIVKSNLISTLKSARIANKATHGQAMDTDQSPLALTIVDARSAALYPNPDWQPPQYPSETI